MLFTLGIDVTADGFAVAAVRGDAWGGADEGGADGGPVPAWSQYRTVEEHLRGRTGDHLTPAELAYAARRCVARVGDPVPLRLAGEPVAPTALVADLVADLIADAQEREGAAADAVVIACPADWTAYRTDALVAALADRAVEGAVARPATVAAAFEYAQLRGLPLEHALAVLHVTGSRAAAQVIIRRDIDDFAPQGPPVVADLSGAGRTPGSTERHDHLASALEAALARADAAAPDVAAILVAGPGADEPMLVERIARAGGALHAPEGDRRCAAAVGAAVAGWFDAAADVLARRSSPAAVEDHEVAAQAAAPDRAAAEPAGDDRLEDESAGAAAAGPRTVGRELRRRWASRRILLPAAAAAAITATSGFALAGALTSRDAGQGTTDQRQVTTPGPALRTEQASSPTAAADDGSTAASDGPDATSQSAPSSPGGPAAVAPAPRPAGPPESSAGGLASAPPPPSTPAEPTVGGEQQPPGAVDQPPASAGQSGPSSAAEPTPAVPSPSASAPSSGDAPPTTSPGGGSPSGGDSGIGTAGADGGNLGSQDAPVPSGAGSPSVAGARSGISQ